MKLPFFLSLLVVAGSAAVHAADRPARDTRRGDRLFADYFRAETRKLADPSLADIRTAEEWTARRDTYRRQFQEMLGLYPMPERTDLRAETTGTLEHPQFRVEKVQFQSRPGLYVTGSLYVPKGLEKPAPAILYVCGHGNIKKDGISYGAKSHYQHHGAWFARNGYVCLIVDTLQLGEIEGLHHGTFHENKWWWLSRGYTPAGVEAWNGIRALDYLQSRPEVDRDRLGVTGRSGGGASSWWLAALDERIKAAVPVAGITDLENHVVDGVVEGHCDCMFMVNTYRWDYAQVAALVSPRALLLSNTDKDSIFPLEGVVRVHEKARRIYKLQGAADKLGLLITEGPHLDTQDLQVPAIRWFNRFLKGDTGQVENTAVKLFEPEQLKVFRDLPADQKNTRIHDVFVPTANPALVATSPNEWKEQRDGWLQALREKTFRGWPEGAEKPALKPAFSAAQKGIRLSAYDFESQEHVPLRLYVAHRDGLEAPDLAVLNVVDDAGWREWLAGMRPGFAAELAEELKTEGQPAGDEKAFAETEKMFQRFKWVMAYIAPRGVGPTAWDATPKKQVQVRRRFMLLGQTLEGMQVWDTRRAIQAFRELPAFRETPLWLQGEQEMAGVALYASLFEPGITRLDLWRLPVSHHQGPALLNVLKTLDLPQAVAMAAERSKVILYDVNARDWTYPVETGKKLGWDPKQLQIRAAGGGR